MDKNGSLAAIEWLDAIQAEEHFWRSWFEMKGLQWQEDYVYRTEGSHPCILERFFENETADPITILDVGAGPISLVGNNSSKAGIVLYACDPLAPLYDSILQAYDVSPYVKTEFAYAESLTDRYDVEFFDIVHMCNALDHTFSPEMVLYSMMEVVKVHGKIILQHYENEAESEAYDGFHKWNISENNGVPYIWNKNNSYAINDIFGDAADISAVRVYEDKPKIIIQIKKKAPLKRRANFYKNHLDEALLSYLCRLLTTHGNKK